MYLNRDLLENMRNGIGLTLTWDVFKLELNLIMLLGYLRLTLTWDVFKCKSICSCQTTTSINLNMRCI